MKYLIITLLFLNVACESPSSSPEPSNEIPIQEPPPEVEPPIEQPEAFDHSLRDPAYSSLPTYDECLYLAQDWVVGDDVYFYWRFSPGDENSFLRVDTDGIIFVMGNAWDDSTWDTQWDTDHTYQVGDCDITIDTPFIGVTDVKWKGILL